MKFYNFLFLASLFLFFACTSEPASNSKKQSTNNTAAQSQNKTVTNTQKKTNNSSKPANQNQNKKSYSLNNMIGKYDWVCCNKQNNGVIDINRKINAKTYSGTMYNSKYADKLSKVTLKVSNSNIVIDRDGGKQIMTLPLNGNNGVIKIDTYESEFTLTKK